MATQNKGALCRCGCGERKTSRKKRFVAGHSAKNRFLNIHQEVANALIWHRRNKEQLDFVAASLK
jgi:hypothetical protein